MSSVRSAFVAKVTFVGRSCHMCLGLTLHVRSAFVVLTVAQSIRRMAASTLCARWPATAPLVALPPLLRAVGLVVDLRITSS